MLKRPKTAGNRFFQQPTTTLAKQLLGTFLSHKTREGTTIGRIVETEAYLSVDDPACHAHRGMTKRNAVMFGPAGHSYVYLIYGMYYCFNVVSGKVGCAEAVLIRALEPVAGIELMKRRRRRDNLRELCSGPGKLAEAMGIGLRKNGSSLQSGPLIILQRESFPHLFHPRAALEVVTSARIGINVGEKLPLRYYLKDNEYVSRR